MTQTIEDLLNVLRGPGAGALVIGFDGTAALLGHPDHYRLSDQVQGNRSARDIRNFISAEVQSKHDPYERYQYVRSITIPRTGRQAETAIQVIASLLQEKHVNVIIATDPHKALYNAISQRVTDLQWIAGDGFTPEHTDSFLKDRQERRVFFDAGGTLIRGFRDGLRAEFGRTGGEVKYLEGMISRLQEFLRTYDKLFCWGWCAANVPFPSICPSEPTVHAIGGYTECGDLENDFLAYEFHPSTDDMDHDAADDDHTTTDILDRLASTFVPSPAETAAGVSGGRDQAGNTPPLLPEDALISFTRPLDTRPEAIHLVGIENQIVRRTTANWLYRKVLSMGEPSVLREGWALDELGRYLTLQTNRPVSQHIVGCFTAIARPNSGDTEWQVRLQAMLRYWISELYGHGSETHRLTFFVPTWVNEWIVPLQRTEPEFGKILVSQYYESTIFKESTIEDWLKRSLSQLSAGLPPADFPILAKNINGTNDNGPGIRLSMIPEALGFWITWLTDSQSALLDRRDLSALEITQVWQRLQQKYVAIEGLLAPAATAFPSGEDANSTLTAAAVPDPLLDWELQLSPRAPSATAAPAEPEPAGDEATSSIDQWELRFTVRTPEPEIDIQGEDSV